MDILKRIIAAQQKEDSPFFKDTEGRIIELTSNKGEVYTGYYQADDGTYYSEEDWLEHQRQEELKRIAEEEYEAQQRLLAKQRAEREEKKRKLEAQPSKLNNSKGLSQKHKILIFGAIIIIGAILLGMVFWPSRIDTSAAGEKQVVEQDTVQKPVPKQRFGNAIITGNDVRMRAEPNLEGKIITFFPKEGEEVLLLQAATDSLNWAQVQRENGTTGWVYAEYVMQNN